MNQRLQDMLSSFGDVQATIDLLQYDFVRSALLAAAVLALVAGVLGPLIVSRQWSFAVHGSSELSLTGASAALLLGVAVGPGAIVGSVLAAVVFALLGNRARERDSTIGVIMSFGLGLSVLFLWLYPGRTGTSFSLLVGQIVGVGTSELTSLIIAATIVLIVSVFIYRPLLYASTDPEVAAARGVPVRSLGLIFAVLVGVACALGVQIVGALLVLSLLITPAAAAARLTADPVRTTILAILFAEVAAVGGILLSLAPGVPVSTFVTTISFLIYLICRLVGPRLMNRRRDPVAAVPGKGVTSRPVRTR